MPQSYLFDKSRKNGIFHHTTKLREGPMKKLIFLLLLFPTFMLSQILQEDREYVDSVRLKFNEYAKTFGNLSACLQVQGIDDQSIIRGAMDQGKLVNIP